MKKLYPFFAAWFFVFGNGFGQEACDCQEVFEQVVLKIEENYIAYHLKKENIQQDYEALISQYEKESSKTSNEGCTKLIQSFLRFFEDGHLFVSQFPKLEEEQIAKHKEKLQHIKYDIEKVYAYLLDSKNDLSPVEGLWTDGASKFAIIKNSKKEWTFEYVAIIIEAPEQEKIGELKIGWNEENQLMEGTYFSNKYTPRYTALFAHNEFTLLSIWGGILWGKIDFMDQNSLRNAVPFDPKLPKIQSLNEETVLLSVPSFLLEKKVFDEVLDLNKKLLSSSKNLIVDIRGNSGGNGIYFNLLSYYADKPLQSKIGKALASKDNISYFERFASRGKNNPYAPVVEDMKKNMGKIVKGPRFYTRNVKRTSSRLEKIIILTNDANMSAAETFILHSKRISDKVLTIGQNTNGVVDYNNINMIKISCDPLGIYFGYPMYTYHERIPKDGYNENGIAPDIHSEKKGEDLIQFALEYLKQ